MEVSSTKRSIYLVYLTSFIANALVFFFVYLQISGVSQLNTYWSESVEQDIKVATELTKVERTIGYVGFIHHFKNYVIRGDEVYFQRAKAAYQQAQLTINELKALASAKQEKEQLAVIEQTLAEYMTKLEVVRENKASLPINQLDQLVKVDDNAAEDALNHLREVILPRQEQQHLFVEGEFESLSQSSLLLAVILLPFFVVATVFTVKLLKNILSAYQEITLIFNMTPDGIIYSDGTGAILQANKAACDMFGYRETEFLSLTIEDLIGADLRKTHAGYRQEFLTKEQSKEMGDRNAHIVGIRKDGSEISVKISISSRMVDNERKAVCVVKDITERNRLEEHAHRDHLTRLHNRRYFDEALIKELLRNERKQQSLSLIMIDLDHFKELNDEQGHAVGDMALKELAEFLKDNTREYDHLVRWGGDEFILLCPDLSVEHAISHAERIRQGFKSLKFPWGNTLTLSIGIATASNDRLYSVSGIMHAADKAVYQAKNAGRDKVMHIAMLDAEN